MQLPPASTTAEIAEDFQARRFSFDLTGEDYHVLAKTQQRLTKARGHPLTMRQVMRVALYLLAEEEEAPDLTYDRRRRSAARSAAQRAVLDTLRAGSNKTQAARKAGISTRTISRWCRADRLFCREYDRMMCNFHFSKVRRADQQLGEDGTVDG